LGYLLGQNYGFVLVCHDRAGAGESGVAVVAAEAQDFVQGMASSISERARGVAAPGKRWQGAKRAGYAAWWHDHDEDQPNRAALFALDDLVWARERGGVDGGWG